MIPNVFKLLVLFLISLLVLKVNTSGAQTGISDSASDTIKIKLNDRRNIDTSNFNAFPKSYSDKKIALVLSGGGARGISQLGAINVLEKNNVRINMIVGTSIGSILGGLYSSGYNTMEIKSMLNKLNWERALSLTNKYQRTSLFLEQKKIQDRSLLTIPLDGLKPVLLPSSFSNGQYLSEKLNSYILNSRYHPVKNFSDLNIPFIAVATDLKSGKRVELKEGNLSESIKASFTFPLLYAPVNIKGRELVDGGLTSNIPVEVAKLNGADYVIVVNSTSPLKTDQELENPLNTADQILSITMLQLNKLQLKGANTIIDPEIGNYSSTNFKNFDYLIKKGEEAAESVIDKILKDIDSIETSESSNFNNFYTNPVVSVESDYEQQDFLNLLRKLTNEKFEKYTSVERNLRTLYKTGYFRDVYAVVSRSESSANINYILQANPVLYDIRITGFHKFLDEHINNFKKINLGKVVNHNELLKLYESILGELRNHSFPAAGIKKFYLDNKTGILSIEITSGNIDSLVLKGNKITNNNVILREVKIETEKPLKTKDLNSSIKNVMSTNLFNQVSFDFDYEKYSAAPDLEIKVLEKNAKALRISLKADNEKNLQLLIDLRDENLFGTGIETGILAAGGLRNRIYQFEFKSNQFFTLPLTYNLNCYYNFSDIYRYEQITDTIKNEYQVNRIGEYRNLRSGGISFLFGTQLQRLGTIYAQGIFENQEIRNKSNSESITEDLRVLKFKMGGIFDTQDVLPFPTEGTLINFFYESASNTLEGNFSYSKLYFGYEQNFAIARSHVLKPKFIFGFADKTTPLTEQYSIGGEKSFFGMVEDELRGRQILECSLEYRYMFPYKVFFDTYFSFRYDIGNVWQVTEDIRFKDLRHGFGLSAGFDTPLGEASFSVGKSFLIRKGLTKDSFVFGPYDFYFSIGYDI